jgi:hypothetical protein
MSYQQHHHSQKNKTEKKKSKRRETRREEEEELLIGQNQLPRPPRSRCREIRILFTGRTKK